MATNPDIQKIIEESVYAPSGDNSQPWRFLVQENLIKIFSVPERDNPLYNFNQNGSLVAIGALIENLVISSSALGYNVDVELSKEDMRETPVALLSLVKSDKQEDQLYSWIRRRTTNRKAYGSKKLTSAEKESLSHLSDLESINIHLIEERESINKIAEAVSVNEKVVLENKELHNYFFAHVRWTEEEERRERSGLYVETLELSKFQKFGFKLFSHWFAMKFFNRLSFADMVAKDNARIYASSSAFGVISMPSRSPQEFIIAGRVMQRLWLKATELGLSLQPVTGVLFLMHRITGGGSAQLREDHIELIKNAYGKIEEEFNLKGEVMVMLFRIGRSAPPSGTSSRLPPVVAFPEA